MVNYFIAEGSGRMKGEKTIDWKFPEFGQKFLIHVPKIEPGDSVIFEREG